MWRGQNPHPLVRLLHLLACSVFGVLTTGQFFLELDCLGYGSLMYRLRAKEIVG